MSHTSLQLLIKNLKSTIVENLKSNQTSYNMQCCPKRTQLTKRLFDKTPINISYHSYGILVAEYLPFITTVVFAINKITKVIVKRFKNGAKIKMF